GDVDHAGDGGLFLLDAGRVGEHDAHEVARRGGTVDGAFVTLADQVGQVAAVVDVGVAEDDGVQGRGVKGEVGVAFAGLAARAQVQAAVHQDAAAAGLDKV